MSRINQKKAWIVGGIAAAVILCVYIIYRVKKQDFLNHGITNMVQNKSNQLYTVKYDSIYVNEVNGNLFLKNLQITGDTTLQLNMINSNDTNAAKVIFNIFIPALEVNSFKTAKALIGKQMECSSIQINHPVITAYLFPNVKKPSDDKKYRAQIYKQLLGNFNLIKADKVAIANAEVIAKDFNSKEVKFHTYNTSIALTGLAIDSTYNQDTSRTLFCKEIEVKSEKVVLGDRSNTAEISNLQFDTRNKLLQLGSFQYDAFKNNGFFKTTVEGINLQGLNFTGPLENSTLVIDKAIIDKGNLESLTQQQSSSKSSGNKQILTGWLQSFTINYFKIKSINYTAQPVDKKAQPFHLNNNSLVINNIHLDRKSKLDASLLNNVNEVVVSNEKISITSGDKKYKYTFDGLRLNTKERSFHMNSFNINPQLSETAFANSLHHQGDRYDIHFRNIHFSGINLEKLLDGNMEVDRVTTSNNEVKVYRDMNATIDSAKMSKSAEKFPDQLLFEFNSTVDIKKFIASNTTIEYKERNAISKNSGRVRFVNSTINISNINNLQGSEAKNMVINFNSHFLGKIPMTGSFIFYTANWRKGNFAVKANIDKSFDATILNELTQPMALAKIEKGTINKVAFDMSGDTLQAKGHLLLPYQDLKVSLLKNKGKDYNKKGLLSLLANIVVKNKNEASGNMRVADVVYKRDRYKSYFNYIWKTMFKCLREVLVLKL